MTDLQLQTIEIIDDPAYKDNPIQKILKLPSLDMWQNKGTFTKSL